MGHRRSPAAPKPHPPHPPTPYSMGDLVTDSSFAVPARRPLLVRVAVWSFIHRRRAIATWLLALVALTAIGQAAGSQFLDSFGGGSSQSQQAQDLLVRNFPADAG